MIDELGTAKMREFEAMLVDLAAKVIGVDDLEARVRVHPDGVVDYSIRAYKHPRGEEA